MSEGGVFRWHEEKAGEAHHKNQQVVAQAMRHGVPYIVVDALNLLPYVISPYVRLAKYYKYDWSIEEPNTPWAVDIDELTLKNTHNVPRSVIEAMYRAYDGMPLASMITTLSFETGMDPEVALRKAQEALEVSQQIIDYRDWRTIGGYEPIGGDDTANNISDKLNSWRAEMWAMGF
jgi:hypothetical protein